MSSGTIHSPFTTFVVRRLMLGALAALLPWARGSTQAPHQPDQRPVGTATLTLREAVKRALEHNHDVQLARLRVDSARAERTIARALPNPVVSATPGVPSQYGAEIPLDVGPARHYRSVVSTLGASASVLDLADVERQVRFAIRAAFVDLLLADSLRALADEQVAIFGQLLAADTVRLRAGSIAERDVLTTRLQLAHAEAAAARARVTARATRLALASLMGSVRIDTTLAVVGTLRYRPLDSLPDVRTLESRALTRPDLSAAGLRVRQGEASRSVARSSALPVPMVGVAWQPAQPFASGSHFAPAVGLTLPLLYLGRGERSRAAAGLASAAVTAERTLMQVRAETAGALDAYNSSRVLAVSYACGLKAGAADAMASARYAYDRGATSLLDLLEAVRTYGDTRTDELTALHDYWLSVFALERATATDVVSDEFDADAEPQTWCAPPGRSPSGTSDSLRK